LRTSNCSLLLIYLPRKDERLSRPGWLTYSGRFIHISGHPSAAGRAQDSESSPVRDRRSTTVPRNQPKSRVGVLCSQFAETGRSPYYDWAWSSRWGTALLQKLYTAVNKRREEDGWCVALSHVWTACRCSSALCWMRWRKRSTYETRNSTVGRPNGSPSSSPPRPRNLFGTEASTCLRLAVAAAPTSAERLQHVNIIAAPRAAEQKFQGKPRTIQKWCARQRRTTANADACCYILLYGCNAVRL